MKPGTSPFSSIGSLRRKFVIFYIGFALIPFGLMFYLYTQYGRGSHTIGVSQLNLGVLILMVGVASVVGFVTMRDTLVKIMRLAESVRDSVRGGGGKELIHEFSTEEGEVAEIAKSFSVIIGQLESNIDELEATKEKLHDVLSKVGKALS